MGGPLSTTQISGGKFKKESKNSWQKYQLVSLWSGKDIYCLLFKLMDQNNVLLIQEFVNKLEVTC